MISKFSIDKIRLKFYVPEVFAGYVLEQCEKRGYVDREKDVTIGKDYFKQYRLSVVVHDESESNLWWGFDHIKENETPLRKSFVIDFNPNKHPVDSGFFQIIREAMKGYLWEGPYVKSVDLAFDFENATMEEINVTVLGVRRKGTYQDTSYFGDRQNEVKKYDKTKERARNGVEIPNTVRVEITRPFKGHLSLFELKKVDVSKVIVSQHTKNADVVLKCLSYCLATGYINETQLTRHYLRKIQAYSQVNQISLTKIMNDNWDWEMLRLRLYFGLDDYWVNKNLEEGELNFGRKEIRPDYSIGNLFNFQA